jgi:microcystin-dependent protein
MRHHKLGRIRYNATESHTLSVAEIPAHSHGGGAHTHEIPALPVNVGASSGAATQAAASGNVLATAALAAGGGNGNGGNAKVTNIFNAGPANVFLGAGSATAAGTTGSANGGSDPVGGGQPHATMPPFLTGNCIIAVVGIFPSRS